jgi:tetratricopeptide (TPR) repeat protein
MGEGERAESPRIEELRRRVQADPASIAFAALAEEYRRIGNFANAIETCLAGLKRHPSYLSAHVTLGRAFIEVERFDEAERELQFVLKAAPENLAAIRGLAEIHHRRRDHVYDAEARALSELPVHAEPAPAEPVHPPAPLMAAEPEAAPPHAFVFEPAAFGAPAPAPVVEDLPVFAAPTFQLPEREAPQYAPAPYDAPTFSAPVYEPPEYDPPAYDPPGTFELPQFASAMRMTESMVVVDDLSGELAALEDFLGAVMAARGTLHAH